MNVEIILAIHTLVPVQPWIGEFHGVLDVVGRNLTPLTSQPVGRTK